MDLDTDEMFTIMEYTRNKKLSFDMLKGIEDNLKYKLNTSTALTLKEQQREKYSIIANYLLILVEHLYQDGRKEEALDIFYKYTQENRRFTAYIKLVREAIEKSSLVGWLNTKYQKNKKS